MRKLTINDSVYGSYSFTEPVLIELIRSKPIQRLKGIAQYGVPDEWFHKKGFSRFDHSVGVSILLARLGAPIKSQIAGVIHDISHTAFSHVADWVFENHKEEDFQDKLFFGFLSNNMEINEILNRNSYAVKEFEHLHQFPLLEKPIPELCADRIDYSLRELVADGHTDTVKRCLESLIVRDSTICFSSKEIAILFRDNFSMLQNKHWASDETNTRYHLLSEAVKEALRIKTLTFEDLLADDAHVIKKLRESDNAKIKQNIAMLSSGEFAREKFPGVKKNRYVEPSYLEGKTIRVLHSSD